MQWKTNLWLFQYLDKRNAINITVTGLRSTALEDIFGRYHPLMYLLIKAVIDRILPIESPLNEAQMRPNFKCREKQKLFQKIQAIIIHNHVIIELSNDHSLAIWSIPQSRWHFAMLSCQISPSFMHSDQIRQTFKKSETKLLQLHPRKH